MGTLWPPQSGFPKAASWAPLGSAGWPPSAVTGEAALSSRLPGLQRTRRAGLSTCPGCQCPWLQGQVLTPSGDAQSDPRAILPWPRGAGGAKGLLLGTRRASKSKARHCLPPQPRGRKRWTKKRQPDGRGAKGKESEIGKEPKEAEGWGPASEGAGRGQGPMPEGRRGSAERPRGWRG